jgi:hydroxyethylthiazole kinase-like uncharacterized protein yjeF
MQELLTPAEMAQVDARMPNLPALIQAAGRAVARAICEHFFPCRVLVLAGPGHNGADGAAAAEHLRAAGWPVTVKRPADATLCDIRRAGLVIDAVLGAGLSRDFAGPAVPLLRAARRIVAVDMPSGLDGATGAVRGFAARAALTVTFFRAKPGHYLLPGRALCGELIIRDIGIPSTLLPDIQTWLNSPALWALPVRTTNSHKYISGDVTVLSGTMPGAARLACAAARHTGAGMVTLATDTGFIPPEAGLIVRTDPLATLLKDERRKTFVCGPGLGPTAAEKFQAIVAAGRQIVADADALTGFAGAPESLRGATIITPHEGEFARLFGPRTTDKLTAARAAASLTGAVTVLKGADTVIAAPDGRAAINNNAPDALATGGTGDVLSGICAALLAQNMAPFEAACAAVWLHGAAGAECGPGLLAEDLPLRLQQARRGALPLDPRAKPLAFLAAHCHNQ